MHLRTKQVFERLQRQKDNLCSDLGSWAPHHLSFRAGPSEWSAREVLDHLVRTERSILAMMMKLHACRTGGESLNRARNFFVRILMWSPFKVRVPESAKATIWPSDGKSPSALFEEWNAQRLELLNFINELPIDESAAPIFRHPVGGWTDAIGALRFVRSHIAHHKYQLRRIKRRARFATIL